MMDDGTVRPDKHVKVEEVGCCVKCYFFVHHDDGEKNCELIPPIDIGKRYIGYALENDEMVSVSEKCPLKEVDIYIRIKESL